MVRAPGNCAHMAASAAHTMPRYTRHQHHVFFVVWIKASRMYCSAIKAFDHPIKSIKMLFIHHNFPIFSKCHSKVWQGDISLSSAMCCFVFFWVLRLGFVFLGGGIVYLFGVFPPVFWGPTDKLLWISDVHVWSGSIVSFVCLFYDSSDSSHLYRKNGF